MPTVQGKPKATGSAPPKQVNIRVSQGVADALDAAAYVREYRGLQELVAPELEKFADRLRAEPAVVEAINARERRRREAK